MWPDTETPASVHVPDPAIGVEHRPHEDVRKHHDADDDAPERDRAGQTVDSGQRVREGQIDRRQNRNRRERAGDCDGPRPQRRSGRAIAEEVPRSAPTSSPTRRVRATWRAEYQNGK